MTGSGVRVFEWTQQFIRRMELDGCTDGWAFRPADGTTQALSAYYGEDIYCKLEYLQKETKLIEPECDVREEFGTLRLGRRFFHTECLNQQVSITDIKFQCR